jgi:MOSC domain-containing protein YiiM
MKGEGVKETNSGEGVLLSVNVGMPAELRHGSKTVESGILKVPAEGPVRALRNGLPGDGQADKVNHGGPDRAACVYTYDHRSYWENLWGKPCGFGAFGENFSISGYRETDVHIGDIFRIGTALFQVTQPRMPCFKLGMRHGRPLLPDEVLKSGFTGWYFRVLEEGAVAAGDRITRIEKRTDSPTVAEAAHTAAYRKRDRDAIRRVLEADGLSADWRDMMAGRLAKLEAGE